MTILHSVETGMAPGAKLRGPKIRLRGKSGGSGIQNGLNVKVDDLANTRVNITAMSVTTAGRSL